MREDVEQLREDHDKVILQKFNAKVAVLSYLTTLTDIKDK